MITFARLYKPSAVVTIGAVEARDINAPPPAPRGPRIAFSLKRTMTQEPDAAEIRVWNLLPERERAMVALFGETGRSPVTLMAGYGFVTPIIFRGDCRRMESHQKDGADYFLRATADDGGDTLAELTLSYFTAGWTAQNMIDIAIARFAQGDPTKLILPYPITPHPSVAAAIAAAGPAAAGSVFSGAHVGKATDLFDEAARILKCRWWVADNFLYMGQRGIPTDGLAIVLRRVQWLQEPSDDGKGLVRHSVFFDPNLVPGRQVTLVDDAFRRSSSPEVYRVETVEHRGDTHAGPWQSALVLRRSEFVA